MVGCDDIDKQHNLKHWLPDLTNTDNWDNTLKDDYKKSNREWFDILFLRKIKRQCLNDFDFWCATHLISYELAKWVKKKKLYLIEKEDCYEFITSWNNNEHLWTINKNPDGTVKDAKYNNIIFYREWYFQYKDNDYSMVERSVFSCKEGDDDFADYMNNNDFNYTCAITVYHFLELISDKNIFEICPSPLHNGKMICYFINKDYTHTYLRTFNDDIEFDKDEWEYMFKLIIDKLIK